MTTYAHGQGGGAFAGAVYDGTYIWLAPLSSANLVRVTPATGAMTTYAHGQGAGAFAGAVYDGTDVWLAPYNSSNLVRVTPAIGKLIILSSVAGAFTLDNVSVKKLVTGIIGSKSIASADLSTRDAITVWLRCSADVAFGEMQFLLDNTALCASPIETLNVPVLVANKWTRVVFRLSATEDDTAIISIGVQVIGNNQNSDLGAYTLDIYQPRIFDEFEGRKAFSITHSVDSMEETDYQSNACKEFKVTTSNWNVTIEGHKEGPPPLLKGQSYLFAFVESNSIGQAFVGEGFYSGFTPAGNFSDIVQYPYTIQGISYLHQPTQ